MAIAPDSFPVSKPISSIVEVSTRLPHAIRLVVPDEWYRRSKSRSSSHSSLSLDNDTVKNSPGGKGSSGADSDDDKEDEEDGTAKANRQRSPTTPARSPQSQKTSPSTGSVNRLSSLFDGWLHLPTSPVNTPPTAPNAGVMTERLSVSEPLLLDIRNSVGLGLGLPDNDDDDPPDEEEAEFEAMMDELGVKADKRPAMRQMPPDRKRYLLQQNRRNFKPSTPSPSPAVNRLSTISASYGPSSGVALTKLTPHLTGDPNSGGLMKRFSLAGIAGWTPGTPALPVLSPTAENGQMDMPSTNGSEAPTGEAATPLIPQVTGGLFSGWFSASVAGQGGSDVSGKPREGASAATNEVDKDKTKTPAWYADGIRRK